VSTEKIIPLQGVKYLGSVTEKCVYSAVRTEYMCVCVCIYIYIIPIRAADQKHLENLKCGAGEDQLDQSCEK
jgi:hypothetical protein